MYITVFPRILESHGKSNLTEFRKGISRPGKSWKIMEFKPGIFEV